MAINYAAAKTGEDAGLLGLSFRFGKPQANAGVRVTPAYGTNDSEVLDHPDVGFRIRI